jgi:hypothetical protein
MAQTTQADDDHDATQQLQSSGALERREASGRATVWAGLTTLARWKRAVFAALPGGSDQQRADWLNWIARNEGYDNSFTAHDIVQWRLDAVHAQPFPQIQSHRESGNPLVLLRQFVRQMGKEAVKQLVDSL